MNQKDEAIFEVVERLELGKHGWTIVPHWDGDLAAIGIGARDEPDRLVYISTYKRPLHSYYYECEISSGPRSEDYEVVSLGEVTTIDDLERIVRGHLSERLFG